jgi:hypothetical protein
VTIYFAFSTTSISTGSHYFNNPARPVVMAMMQPALLVLQEYKSMEVTSDNGYGFVNAVRLKRNGMIFPFAEYSPCHASLELRPVGPKILPLLLVLA